MNRIIFKLVIVTLLLLVVANVPQTFASTSEGADQQKSKIHTQTKEEQEKGKKIDEQFMQIAPFVKIDKRNMATIDVQAAKDANVPHSVIQVAERYYQEQNRMIEAITNGKTMMGFTISKEVMEEFQPYFGYIAGGKNKPLLPPTLPPDVSTEAEGGCGYNTDNPHPCPVRKTLYYFYSMEYLQNKFWGDGYHSTAYYAGGAAPWNPARDFTKCVDAYNCTHCAFRYQGVIADTIYADQFNGVVQVPEPNPEISSYTWPDPSWGLYVKWWHEKC